MSIGLRLMSRAVEDKNLQTIVKFNEEYYVGEDEKEVYRYIKHHYDEYQELPVLDTIEKETGVEIPAAIESLSYYRDKIKDRKFF